MFEWLTASFSSACGLTITLSTLLDPGATSCRAALERDQAREALLLLADFEEGWNHGKDTAELGYAVIRRELLKARAALGGSVEETQ